MQVGENFRDERQKIAKLFNERQHALLAHCPAVVS